MAKFRKMQRDVEKLRKLNTSYKRKARRVKNLYGVDLDYDVMYIDDFTSRKQFNDYVKQMEKVTSYSEHRYVKNKYGMVIKREHYQEYNETVKKLKVIAEKEKVDLLKSLKQLGYEPDIDYRRMMGDRKFDRFIVDYKFDKYSDSDFFLEHFSRLKKKLDPGYWRDGDKRLKENFISAIDESLGAVGQPLKKRVQSMSVKDFKLFFYAVEIPLFSYVYSLEQAEKITNKILSLIYRFYGSDK